MRFASLGGQGNYAQAGKAVADDAAKTFKAARRNSVDFDGIAQSAMKNKSNENIAQTRADTIVKKAEINEEGRKAKMGAAKAGVMRKAGGLIALGMDGFRKEEKADYSFMQSRIDRDRAKATELRTEAEGMVLPETSKASTPTNTGGTGATNVSTTAASGTPGDGSGWSRMSKVIKSGEGTLGDKGYTTQFTGTQFSDMSKHPAQIRSANGLSSDAAGAYQFLSTTYNPAAKALGITDFSPQSQEKVGKYLAQQRGMNTDIVHTDKASFLKALDKIAPEWASMPTIKTGTSYYGQGGLTPDEAWSIYNS